jgi:hypothetical protein
MTLTSRASGAGGLDVGEEERGQDLRPRWGQP